MTSDAESPFSPDGPYFDWGILALPFDCLSHLLGFVDSAVTVRSLLLTCHDMYDFLTDPSFHPPSLGLRCVVPFLISHDPKRRRSASSQLGLAQAEPSYLRAMFASKDGFLAPMHRRSFSRIFPVMKFLACREKVVPVCERIENEESSAVKTEMLPICWIRHVVLDFETTSSLDREQIEICLTLACRLLSLLSGVQIIELRGGSRIQEFQVRDLFQNRLASIFPDFGNHVTHLDFGQIIVNCKSKSESIPGEEPRTPENLIQVYSCLFPKLRHFLVMPQRSYPYHGYGYYEIRAEDAADPLVDFHPNLSLYDFDPRARIVRYYAAVCHPFSEGSHDDQDQEDERSVEVLSFHYSGKESDLVRLRQLVSVELAHDDMFGHGSATTTRNKKQDLWSLFVKTQKLTDLKISTFIIPTIFEPLISLRRLHLEGRSSGGPKYTIDGLFESVSRTFPNLEVLRVSVSVCGRQVATGASRMDSLQLEDLSYDLMPKMRSLYVYITVPLYGRSRRSDWTWRRVYFPLIAFIRESILPNLRILDVPGYGRPSTGVGGTLEKNPPIPLLGPLSPHLQFVGLPEGLLAPESFDVIAALGHLRELRVSQSSEVNPMLLLTVLQGNPALRLLEVNEKLGLQTFRFCESDLIRLSEMQSACSLQRLVLPNSSGLLALLTAFPSLIDVEIMRFDIALDSQALAIAPSSFPCLSSFIIHENTAFDNVALIASLLGRFTRLVRFKILVFRCAEFDLAGLTQEMRKVVPFSPLLEEFIFAGIEAEPFEVKEFEDLFSKVQDDEREGEESEREVRTPEDAEGADIVEDLNLFHVREVCVRVHYTVKLSSATMGGGGFFGEDDDESEEEESSDDEDDGI